MPEPLFPVEREYARCIAGLERAGIVAHLSQARCMGVFGRDGSEYPLPSREQVADLFSHNQMLIASKVPQGFDRLELTPLALPLPRLMDLLTDAIVRQAAKGEIRQTRRAPDDPLVPVRVNKEKQVWIWSTLKQAIETDTLVYFPQEHTGNPEGLTKSQVVHDGHICAVPGWSVSLVESVPFLPQQGQGKTLGGRKQLEVGLSPNEYLQILQTPAYHGETGQTLEEFLTRFLIHLETTSEVSYDVADDNALWCLGQYLKVPYAELVPTGRWFRNVGRVRLDMHRTNNKACTKSWGAASTVRLQSLAFLPSV